MDDNEKIRLRVCSAILTNNRRELEWATSQPIAIVGEDLHKEAQAAYVVAPIPGNHGLVHLTNYLPAFVQYIGQRAVLLFPRIARRILRSSGLHHQMF
jgi:hypothetical protein